jgi:uncharacterized membrane protein YgcG
MSLTDCRKLKWPLFFVCSAALFCFFAITQFAQTGVPSRTGYVNDFAAVLDEPTRAELTTILANLKEKTGIELAIVTVDSTGGQDIFDFSQKLAREWNVGARSSARKSLLMVLSVSDRSSFTQFSRSVQPELPEGVLGDLAHRMRAYVEAGRFSDGVNAGVRHFVGSMAEKLAINADEFTRASEGAAETSKVAPSEPAGKAVRTTTPPVTEATPESTPTFAPVTITSSATTVAGPTRLRRVTASTESTNDDDESEAVELTLTLPVEARVAKLKEFLQQHPTSKSRGRATELLVSAHAPLVDERLKRVDIARGVEK